MTISSRAPESDHEPLCTNVLIGRVLNRYRWSTHLRLTVEFFRRQTSNFGGSVKAAEARYQLRGSFMELQIQVRSRPAPWITPADEWSHTGLDQFGDPDGPWPPSRFLLATGIDLDDLTRLAALSRRYNRNWDHAPANAPSRAVFIPREAEQEIRDIAERLRR